MFSQRPGVRKALACQRASVDTESEITWLMLNVPATKESWPACRTPSPIAAALLFVLVSPTDDELHVLKQHAAKSGNCL